MYRVAVLLAAYNGKRWLTEQLASILNQTGVSVDVFFSVDLSDDGTYEWCRYQQKIYSNVTVLGYGERFGGAARNFFRLIHDVEFSSYDYVALADQDDIWMKKKLSYAIEVIKKNDSDAFSSDVIAFWQDNREKLVKKSYPQKRFDFFFEAAGPGCTYMFTVKSFQQFKLFLTLNWVDVNEVALHDWMIYSYYRSNNLKWMIDNKALMRYRQHADNQVGFNSGFKAASKRWALVKDEWYFKEVNKIANLSNADVKLELNRWFLIKNFFQLRRRPRDALALLIMIIIGLL